MSKVSEKQYIKDLEHDLDSLSTMYLDMKKEKEKIEQDLKSLILRTPSSYLTDNGRTDEWRIEQFNRNRAVEDQVKTIDEMKERVKELFSGPKYIYERNPDTGDVYRRELGDYDNKTLCVEQLELFQSKN